MKQCTENGNYIKLIPIRYKDIENLNDLLEDESRKRLTEKERLNLELELFKTEIRENKYVFELIQSSKLIGVQIIRVRNNDPYYTAVFDNNIKVKCSENLFNICKDREELFITL